MNGRAGLASCLMFMVFAGRCAAQVDSTGVQAQPQVIYTVPTGHSIWVDKGNQRVYAFDGNQLVISVLCSTASHHTHWASGDGRYLTPSTPLGDYRIFEKTPDHWSHTYEVHMRYAMFYDGGRAIHATTSSYYRMLGRPASGGCVRVTRGHAIALYGWAQIGDPVHVVRRLPDAYLAIVAAYRSPAPYAPPIQPATPIQAAPPIQMLQPPAGAPRTTLIRRRRRHPRVVPMTAATTTPAIQPRLQPVHPKPVAPVRPAAPVQPTVPVPPPAPDSTHTQPVTPGSSHTTRSTTPAPTVAP
ncbi:MAG: L,D-transpeptidase family protein [Armatimonadota bacterium]|nr:L,D-transpeptidase family protein [Armatimonadota bacterium]